MTTTPSLLSDDETLEQAYDLFLQLAADNLDPADILLFNLQFEQRGSAELYDPSPVWRQQLGFTPDPALYAEIVIGLAEQEEGPVTDVFARMLLSRDTTQKRCDILWKE